MFQEIYSRLDTVSPFIIYELRISTEMASGATKTIISSYGLDLNILLWYNAAYFRTKIRHFYTHVRAKEELYWPIFLFCYVFYDFTWSIEIYLHAVFLHDIL